MFNLLLFNFVDFVVYLDYFFLGGMFYSLPR